MYLQAKNIVMVTTKDFVMHTNKRDVQFIAHMNIPKGIEVYYSGDEPMC